MGRVVHDTFTDADLTLITAHTADSGQGWAEPAGDMKLSGGTIIATLNGSNANIDRAITADGVWIVRFKFGTVAVSQAASIRFRYSDNANFLFANVFMTADGTFTSVRFWERRANVLTQLVTATITPTLVRDTWHELKVIARGLRLVALIDSVQKIDYLSDGFNRSARTCGIAFDNTYSAGQAFDDFAVWAPDVPSRSHVGVRVGV